MRVFIACLAFCNADTPQGGWIDLSGLDADGLREEIEDMLRRSPCPAEAWVALEYEGLPNLGKHPSIDQLIEVAKAVSKHGPAMHIWVDYTGTVEGFKDAYYGTAESWEDFAERLLEDTGMLAEMPEHLWHYFDFTAYARDLKLDGWWAEYDPGGRLHFFCE